MKKGGISDMLEQMKSLGLSEQQIKSMEQIEMLHYKKLEGLREEREEVIFKLTKYFSGHKFSKENQQAEPENLTILELVEGAGLLEHLRQSFNNEAEQWNASMNAFHEFFTPRQFAQCYLLCQYQYASVRQLSSFWSTLNEGWAKNEKSWSA